MQKRKDGRKLVACAVILLFFGVAYSPSIYADEYKRPQINNIVCSKNEKLLSIPVREYKPDGTIRTYFVELTESQYNEMNKRLQTTKDLDERLSIYKDYNVVPEDVTSESLRTGMEEKARRFGFESKINEIVKNRENIQSTTGIINTYFNFNCSISMDIVYSIFPSIGLSSITLHLNQLIYLLFFRNSSANLGDSMIFPSIDLLTFCFGRVGFFCADDGSEPDIYFITYEWLGALILGFVGYCIGGFFIRWPGSRWFESMGYASFVYVFTTSWYIPPPYPYH